MYVIIKLVATRKRFSRREKKWGLFVEFFLALRFTIVRGASSLRSKPRIVACSGPLLFIDVWLGDYFETVLMQIVFPLYSR